MEMEKKENKKKYGFDDGYGFYIEEGLENYFNNIYSEYNDMWNRNTGFGFSFISKKKKRK